MIKYAFAAAVVLAATPAIAADFNGPRIEGRVSYDRVSFKVSEIGGPGRVTAHDTGLGYGAEAGFDSVINASLVFGGYAGIENATTKECLTDGTERACLRLGRNITAGVRMGFIASPMLLVYVKGGYSNGRLKVDYRDTALPADNFAEAANRNGVHVGVGAEANVGKSAYVKAEYVRTNYRDYSDSDLELKLDSHRDQGVIGLGLRF